MKFSGRAHPISLRACGLAPASLGVTLYSPVHAHKSRTCLAQPRKAWGELNLTLTTDQSRASAGSVSILVLSCFCYLIFQATYLIPDQILGVCVGTSPAFVPSHLIPGPLLLSLLFLCRRSPHNRPGISSSPMAIFQDYYNPTCFCRCKSLEYF